MILIGQDDLRRWLVGEKDRWKLSPAVDLDALGYSLLSSVVDQDPGIVHEMLQLEVPCIDTPQCTAPNRCSPRKLTLLSPPQRTAMRLIAARDDGQDRGVMHG